MRDRAWRRHIEEKKVKSRLKRFNQQTSWWYSGYSDLNNLNRENPTISDYIGGYLYNKFKTYTTSKVDSRYKAKYSPNKGVRYWRNGDMCREKQKIEFLKILKEYGIK